MGNIQNAINQGIATVGTAMALGEHLNEQKKANEVNKIAAEKELSEAKIAQSKSDVELSQKILKNPLYDTPNGKQNEDFDAEPLLGDDYLKKELDLKQADVEFAASEFGIRQSNYELGLQASKPGSKRLDAAQLAYNEVADELQARKNLKFDLEIARKKLKALGGKE